MQAFHRSPVFFLANYTSPMYQVCDPKKKPKWFLHLAETVSLLAGDGGQLGSDPNNWSDQVNEGESSRLDSERWPSSGRGKHKKTAMVGTSMPVKIMLIKAPPLNPPLLTPSFHPPLTPSPQWNWLIKTDLELAFKSINCVSCTRREKHVCYTLKNTQYWNILVKVILAVMKQLKQSQRKPRKILRLQWDSNPWPLQYWSDALLTELWSLVGSRELTNRASQLRWWETPEH